MYFIEFLAKQKWRFDLLSALIGVVVGLLIALALYLQREQLKALIQKLLEPVRAWQRQAQASDEEKYLKALRNVLNELLLFRPKEPTAVLVTPTLLADAPVPNAMPDASAVPEPLEVPLPNVLQGYPRVLISGRPFSGRTSALLLLYETVARELDPQTRILPRFPVWIDLSHLSSVPEEVSAPLDVLVYLIRKQVPDALPKWLLKQLQTRPTVILVDNWDKLLHPERAGAAELLNRMAALLPQSVWVVATGETGTGHLVEQGFVPLTLKPAQDKHAAMAIYNGWARLLHGETGPGLSEESLAAYTQALLNGESLMEVQARIMLDLKKGELPARLPEVFERLVQEATRFPVPRDTPPELQQKAADIVRKVLLSVAQASRLRGQPLTDQEVKDLMEPELPQDPEQRKLVSGMVKAGLSKSELITRRDGVWRFTHGAWCDFFTAQALLQNETHLPLLLSHLEDPEWAFIVDFYVGLSADASPLVAPLLEKANKPDGAAQLLRALRWSAMAGPDVPWRKAVLTALARAFVDSNTPQPLRLKLTRTLALTLPDVARTFFIQALKQPSLELRCAALRGLGWLGTPKDQAILAAALRDKNVEILESAIRGLADMGTVGAAKQLAQTMVQVDERLMMLIAELVATMPLGDSILKEAAQDEDLLVRRAAAHGLKFVEQAWAEELLKKMAIEDSQWLVRAAADAALVELKEKAHNTTVVPAPPQVDQLPWLVAFAAQRGKGLGVGPAALEMLMQALVLGDAETQRLAAWTLAHVGRPQHADALSALLTESTPPEVRATAEAALKRIQQRYS